MGLFFIMNIIINAWACLHMPLETRHPWGVGWEASELPHSYDALSIPPWFLKYSPCATLWALPFKTHGYGMFVFVCMCILFLNMDHVVYSSFKLFHFFSVPKILFKKMSWLIFGKHMLGSLYSPFLYQVTETVLRLLQFKLFSVLGGQSHQFIGIILSKIILSCLSQSMK